MSQLLAEDPYDKGWLIKIKVDQPVDTSGLMDLDTYEHRWPRKVIDRPKSPPAFSAVAGRCRPTAFVLSISCFDCSCDLNWN